MLALTVLRSTVQPTKPIIVQRDFEVIPRVTIPADLIAVHSSRRTISYPWSGVSRSQVAENLYNYGYRHRNEATIRVVYLSRSLLALASQPQ